MGILNSASATQNVTLELEISPTIFYWMEVWWLNKHFPCKDLVHHPVETTNTWHIYPVIALFPNSQPRNEFSFVGFETTNKTMGCLGYQGGIQPLEFLEPPICRKDCGKHHPGWGESPSQIVSQLCSSSQASIESLVEFFENTRKPHDMEPENRGLV